MAYREQASVKKTTYSVHIETVGGESHQISNITEVQADEIVENIKKNLGVPITWDSERPLADAVINSKHSIRTDHIVYWCKHETTMRVAKRPGVTRK